MAMEIGEDILEEVEEKSGGCCKSGRCGNICGLIEFLMQQFDFTTDILFCVELFNRGDEVGVGFKIAQVIFTMFGGFFSCNSCIAMEYKWKASKIKDNIKRQKSYEEAKKDAGNVNWGVNFSSCFEDTPQLVILLLLDSSIRQLLYGTLTFFGSVVNAAYKGHKIIWRGGVGEYYKTYKLGDWCVVVFCWYSFVLAILIVPTYLFFTLE